MSNKQGYQQVEIREIPSEWNVEKLGRVIEIEKGRKPSQYFVEPNEKMIPYLLAKSIRTGIYDKWVDPDADLVLVDKDDPVLIWDGSKSGDVFIGLKGALASTMVKIKPQEERIEKKFLYYFLKTRFYILNFKTTGTAVPHVRKNVFDNLRLPIPPLPEQQKIAFILSTVDNAIQKTDEIVGKTEMLKLGLMQRLLTRGMGHTRFKMTELGEIPEEWEVVRLGDVCTSGTGGTPSRQRPEYFQGEIPWVKSTEIDFGVISHTEESISSKAFKESSAKLYRKGTLLVALYGQGVTRGKCALLGIDAAINQACGAFQSKGKIQLHFAFFWLQANYRKIRALSQGSNQANLNLGLVRSIKLPLPPLTEQRKITCILSAVDEKVEMEKQRKEQLEKLKKGLMQDLLTGKVRVKVD